MEKQEWIERYIYAVTRHLPYQERADVAKELASIINDMLEERCGEKEPEYKDVKIVLTELGTPEELSQKYNTDKEQCLIGEPYYSKYKYMLKLVIACVVFGMLIAGFLGGVLDQQTVPAMLLQILGNTFGGVCFAFAFVTLLFAYFYQKGQKLDLLYDSLDNLPSVPNVNRQIAPKGSIWNIILSIVFVAVFLCCPNVFCVAVTGEGMILPVFHLEYLRSTWYFIILFAMLGIGRECVKLVDGSYTKRVLVVTLGVDICSAVLAGIWLLNDSVMNPGFMQYMTELFTGSDAFLIQFFSSFNSFLFLIILFALALDAAVALWKTLRNEG